MNRKIILAVLLLTFVGYAGWSFMDAVTPYVGIAEAQKSTGSVQVKGCSRKVRRLRIWRGIYSFLPCRTRTRGKRCSCIIMGRSPTSLMKPIIL